MKILAPFTKSLLIGASLVSLTSCAQVDVPYARNVNIPPLSNAAERQEAINEKPDSVLYLPLGEDVLVPETKVGDPLPQERIGPFELRGETLAGALQLILADYDIPMAFETQEALTRQITVANLHGPLHKVVGQVCSLADLYCAYDDGLLTVKENQLFTVTLPPIGEGTTVLDSVSTGVEAITGSTPVIDESTRTIIYSASQRTSDLAERYFQKLRSNTAMITFEIYIWEVTLDTDNNTGVDWSKFDTIGKFNSYLDLPGTANVQNPISIGIPSTAGQTAVGTEDVIQFLSTYGAVKTISQPQITMLSGSEARLRAANTENYVASISRSVDEGVVTTSSTTGSVDTGFTLTINSNWDNATVYGDIDILVQENNGVTTFDISADASVGLPQTVEREVTTQIRIRPGDSLLIAGLVREQDQFDTSGPGFNRPIFPTQRGAQVSNIELVFLLKPRVVAYVPPEKLPKKDVLLAASPKALQPARVAAVQKEDLSAYDPMMQYADSRSLNTNSVIENMNPVAGRVVVEEPVVAEHNSLLQQFDVESEVRNTAKNPESLMPPAPENKEVAAVQTAVDFDSLLRELQAVQAPIPAQKPALPESAVAKTIVPQRKPVFAHNKDVPLQDPRMLTATPKDKILNTETMKTKGFALGDAPARAIKQSVSIEQEPPAMPVLDLLNQPSDFFPTQYRGLKTSDEGQT